MFVSFAFFSSFGGCRIRYHEKDHFVRQLLKNLRSLSQYRKTSAPRRVSVEMTSLLVEKVMRSSVPY